MNLQVYEQQDYRDSLRLRLKELQKQIPGLTLKKIASRIPVQYTYFSKSLNDEKTHLNEDHLFVVCELLKFLPEERDFILLQRALKTSYDSARKKHLLQKIESIRKQKKLNLEAQQFNASRFYEEIHYLFDPLAVLIHMALDIASVSKNPRLICTKLGLDPVELSQILKKLARNGFIELDEDGFSIKKILRNYLHYGQDHPLMRVHQNLLKTVLQSQLIRCPEEKKYSFIATFTADLKSYEQIRLEFQKFLKNIEEVARNSKPEQLYQMSFDFMRWL